MWLVFDPARYDYTNALFRLSVRLSKAAQWKGAGRGKEGGNCRKRNMEFGTKGKNINGVFFHALVKE